MTEAKKDYEKQLRLIPRIMNHKHQTGEDARTYDPDMIYYCQICLGRCLSEAEGEELCA